ncbi:MAG: DegV family protein [Lachnospiraceae bacterium]|nr:DegV family protein [Lachnospiraceae bacterium]
MGLQIFTDSASDITQAQAAEMNITVIPLTVTFGETSYLDGIDFDKNFYLAYTGHSKELLDKYIEDSLDLYDGKVSDFPTSTVGCAIGTHIGPGAICIAFFCNK